MVVDVTPKQVWEALGSHPQARLVDVRTDYEWTAIGRPDLSGSAKELAMVSWQLAPAMQVNPDFVDGLREAGLTGGEHVYFLCRSGVRSQAAAEAAEAAGFKHVYNVVGGFEGPPDGQGQRGHLAGWQADGLPWVKG